MIFYETTHFVKIFFRSFSVITSFFLLSSFLRSYFVLPSYYLQSCLIVSPLFLHRNDGQSMDIRWTIYGQLSKEERRKSEVITKKERRKNRLVALKDFAQFVECLQVVFIQFSSPAHITMLQLRASGLDYVGKYICL